MSGPITQRTLTVVSALRQSIERDSGPGTSINRHTNPFMLNIIGELDLLKAAELVIERLQSFDSQQKETDPATAASAADGH